MVNSLLVIIRLWPPPAFPGGGRDASGVFGRRHFHSAPLDDGLIGTAVQVAGCLRTRQKGGNHFFHRTRSTVQCCKEAGPCSVTGRIGGACRSCPLPLHATPRPQT